MKYLLDTHVWLWVLESPKKIASPVRAALETADELVLSVASVWETAIKVRLGKLLLQGGAEALRSEILAAFGARELMRGAGRVFVRLSMLGALHGLTFWIAC